MQADGADELLLKTVPPRLSHVRGHHGAGRHTLTVFHFYQTSRPLPLCPLKKKSISLTLKMSLEEKIKTDLMQS